MATTKLARMVLDGAKNILGLSDGKGGVVMLGKVPPTTTTGLTVNVAAFSVDGYDFIGGSIMLPANGTWYVGVELSSSVLRVLPRLGHRGWIPVGKFVCNATIVTNSIDIQPALPVCRIPRTMAKIRSGKGITVCVMGSSLTQTDGSANSWPGMVFGAGTVEKYKLPVTVTAKYRGVGGAPNQYQLAQLGFASANGAYGFSESGYSAALTAKAPPNGRSKNFSDVDLVVIGCLANGGDYRLQVIEPMIRKLRAQGIEVIVVTDNPQNPTTNYETMATSMLYVDGPDVFRIAELYGVEVADTAAYVFEAQIRSGGVGIYGDTIHMATGTPAGVSSLLPANGHEAWARAVRSIFSVGTSTTSLVVNNYSYEFASTVECWTPYSAGTVTQSGGALVVTKNTAANSQWGAVVTLPVTLQIGDTVDFVATATYAGSAPQIGMLNGPWASNSIALAGSGVTTSGKLTVTAASTSTLVLFCTPDTAANGTVVQLSQISLVVTVAGVTSVYDVTPGRKDECKTLPPIRVVTDLKTPADAFVILPKDEQQLNALAATCGVLAANPWGTGSFARQFASTVGAAEDLLILAPTKKAVFAGNGVVGFSIIHYRDVADGACSFGVYCNDSLLKTINISTVPFGNEWYLALLTPTELNALMATSALGNSLDSLDIRVISGTLKVAAFVALTSDLDYVLPEDITYVGTWLPKESSRSGLPGRPTDTLGSYAMLKCTGRRVVWLLSGNPGSKITDFFSDREQLLGVGVGGNYHVKLHGGLLGPGANHVVKCALANAAGDQTNGHALHVGGALIINDR